MEKVISRQAPKPHLSPGLPTVDDHNAHLNMSRKFHELFEPRTILIIPVNIWSKSSSTPCVLRRRVLAKKRFLLLLFVCYTYIHYTYIHSYCCLFSVNMDAYLCMCMYMYVCMYICMCR